MEQSVFINLQGELHKGFDLTVEIGEPGKYRHIQLKGNLPPALKLIEEYQQWQLVYRQLEYSLRLKHQLKDSLAEIDREKNDPIDEFTKSYINDKKRECHIEQLELKYRFNQWLNNNSFQKVVSNLRKHLKRIYKIRIIISSESKTVELLPWHLWELLEDYPDAEIIFNSFRSQIPKTRNSSDRVKILMVLGSTIENSLANNKQALLEQLPRGEITFLEEPTPEEFKNYIWQEKWHILIFAGHSKTADQTGIININQEDSLSITELRSDLKIAVDRGLQLAIFNSCDGLGLAIDLQEIGLPHAIVMREPLPDQILHQFVNYFLPLLAREMPFHLAVRASREILRGLDKEYPCANWLPVIFENVTATPLTWSNLLDRTQLEVAEDFTPVVQVIEPAIAYRELPIEKPVANNTNTQKQTETTLKLARLLITSSIALNVLIFASLFLLRIFDSRPVITADSQPQPLSKSLNASETKLPPEHLGRSDRHLETSAAIEPKIKNVQDPELLLHEIELKAIALAEHPDLEARLEQAEEKFPQDYRFTYQLIKFKIDPKDNRHDRGLKLLEKAAIKAIKNNRSAQLLEDMNRDRVEIRTIRKLYLDRREWDRIVEALEKEDIMPILRLQF